MKTENITTALTRKVAPPIKLNRTPPVINPIMLAKPQNYLQYPALHPEKLCARLERIDIKGGHIRPLPTANKITAPYTNMILFDTNKIKFVPSITLPIITSDTVVLPFLFCWQPPS
jgi:hypothetical protein